MNKKVISILFILILLVSCTKKVSDSATANVASDNPIENLKGKSINLEQFSVSHYLLLRALEENGMKESDVTIVNTPGDDAGALFLAGGSDAVTTWNPHLFLAEDEGKGEVIFSSKDIPGEIIDMVVFDKKVIDANPNVAMALTYAWYDAMNYYNDPATRDDAVKIMAEAAGATVEDFEKMLQGTDLYTSAQKASDFLNSDTIRETEKKVSNFSKNHDLITKDITLSLNSSYVDSFIESDGKPAAVDATDDTKYKVGISIWTGWMPFWLIMEKGFLENRNQEFGVNVELEIYKDYMASVESFAAGSVIGCSMTIMEALQPANSGVDVEAVIINDISNGGDGILVKK